MRLSIRLLCVALITIGIGVALGSATGYNPVAASGPAQVTIVTLPPFTRTELPLPTRRIGPPPTNTPRPTQTPTLAPTAGPVRARLCMDCNRVRLRATPGTAGQILSVLDVNAQFDIIGRSSDSKWVQILIVPGGVGGWVSAQFVRLPDMSLLPPSQLNALPVAGEAVEASPTPTTAFTAGIPPYITGITARSRQIYFRGQQMGNRANVFSKIGDSITASPNFLFPIGFGQYDLGAYGSLRSVIGFFSQANARTGNSFANQSLAAGAGWTADKLLTPGYGFPEVCGGDTPLVCEYKIVRPAVALIMVGTNDSGSGSAEVFAEQLRQIVDISINMGVIPVLSTIPPKNIDENQEQRVDVYNTTIRAIARQFDVPLWDYYAQMAAAPNRGMSADGLHPSVSPDGAACRFTVENLQYGYNLRNLGALQALNAIWRLVMY